MRERAAGRQRNSVSIPGYPDARVRLRQMIQQLVGADFEAAAEGAVDEAFSEGDRLAEG